ncbi:MAG: LarC family nickel insertion protein, partial [Treponema sp.]|nr:LarC family nickel insertion protein [Treponema sp.]
MKTLHFDCFAGISGDMCLGALVDLGVDREALTAELRKLGLEGWKLSFENDQRNGITGLHAVVDIEGSADHIACDDEHEHHHEHGHKHEHEHHHGHEHHHEHSHEHEHEHEHHHGHEHHHEHAHNTWKEIRGIIERSGVGEGAKKRAIAIFTAIAEAEAKVHGSTVDEVAFHEVGALDSIIDIVGTAIALDMLKPDRISCGPVELGGGTVKCAHGELPVPAPATLILVEGMPVKTGGFNREMTTPTGAGILAASVDEFTSGADGVFKILKTGYGTGTRRMEKPNLLRISLRETEKSSDSAAGLWDTEILTLMEANIDDMNAEEFGFLME